MLTTKQIIQNSVFQARITLGASESGNMDFNCFSGFCYDVQKIFGGENRKFSQVRLGQVRSGQVKPVWLGQVRLG